MAELALGIFPYKDYQTVQVLGRRFYDLEPSPLPSITTVLGHTEPPETTGWLDAWKKRVGEAEAARKTRAALDRGTNVHLLLERYLRGDPLQLETFPQEHVKVFNSMKIELGNINTVFGQEVVLYSSLIGVAGRCDLVAEHQGELAIVDYKTSTWMKKKEDIKDYWIQAAFYALAHNEMFGTDISKLVIMMGVENKLPLVFKKRLGDELLVELADRTAAFYDELDRLVETSNG